MVGQNNSVQKKPVYISSDPDLIEKIDAFRYRGRYRTTAAAIRELIQFALVHYPKSARREQK